MFDRNGNTINVGKCVYGREDVTQAQHEQHNHITETLFNVEVPGIEETFVHVRGADDEFDADMIPYVCDRHFIEQIASSITTGDEARTTWG